MPRNRWALGRNPVGIRIGRSRDDFFWTKFLTGAKSKIGKRKHYTFGIIPKGFCHSAQGCEQRATLGKPLKMFSTPTGVVAGEMRAVRNRNGRNRVAVGDVCWMLTQGSSFLATLGFGTESR